MKKLLIIVGTIVLLISNAYSDDIKHKRIECSNKNSDDRFNNFFIVILGNDKTAKVFKSNWTFNYTVDHYDIRTGINFISLETSEAIHYEINRINGRLWSKKERGIVGTCFKMEDGFNPEAFLKSIVEENIAKQKEKNIF